MALEGQEWLIDDASFFMMRLAEIYLEDLDKRDACVATLNQMIKLFPNTSYSTQAAHKLKELSEI